MGSTQSGLPVGPHSGGCPGRANHGLQRLAVARDRGDSDGSARALATAESKRWGHEKEDIAAERVRAGLTSSDRLHVEVGP